MKKKKKFWLYCIDVWKKAGQGRHTYSAVRRVPAHGGWEIDDHYVISEGIF